MKELDITPGPWGIGKGIKGELEVSLDRLTHIDVTGPKIVVVLPNGEIITLPKEITRIKVVRANNLAL